MRWGAVAAVSGVSQCRVPAAPGDPDGKGLGWGPEFHCSSQPDGNVSQSAALPGTARGRGVSSSAALHLHFPNSRPLHYHVHLTAHYQRPWDVVVCAGLLCCAGWSLRLVCSGRAHAVFCVD